MKDNSRSPERRNGRKTLWVFTPSRTDPKDLEFILVQRQKLLQDAVERVRESALTDHKHHLLFVGPRGCGKTHLVTLIVNRLSEHDDLADRLRIAWLNEDETCTTLLEFLLKVHSALEKRYPEEYREDMLSDAYEMKPDAAREFVAQHLLTSLGQHTLLVVTENLDAIFEGLGARGQQELRAFIQENPKLSIVATAQRLVEDLSQRTSPFFGFFQTEHLKPLNVEEATLLLQNIAKLNKETSVVEFLSTSRGRSRVRALHHLSGGNHRIYIVLSQFITRDSIDALLGPFMKMVDELTPYYQERVRWLPPLQRKIVELLCGSEGTVPVKEIAKKLFKTPQTISSQLQDLREKGYVEANERGRESLYEISEPLMRICVEVKENQHHEPLRLLVDFLRVWYDDTELSHRLGKMESVCVSRAYLESAIERNREEGNLRKRLFLQDLRLSLPEKMNSALKDGLMEKWATLPEAIVLAMKSWAEGRNAEAISCLDEAVALESDLSLRSDLLLNRAAFHFASGDHEDAIKDWSVVIALSNVPDEKIVVALFNRGVAYNRSGNTQHAIDDYTAAIGLPAASVEQVAMALVNRGVAYGRVCNTQHAIDDYTAAIGLPAAPVEQVAMALVNRGVAYGRVGDTQLQINDYTAAISLPDSPVEQIAKALFNRASTYGRAGETQCAIDDYTAVISLSNAPVEMVAMALVNRGVTYGKTGDTQRQIEDFTTVISLPNAPIDQVAMALVNRGGIYGQTGETRGEINDYTAVTALPNVPVEHAAKALLYRGVAYGKAGETERELDDYATVISLPNVPVKQVAMALVNRGSAHGRAGETRRELEDYTTVISLPNAPVEQIANALVKRAITYGHTGEAQREIDDYTATIALPNAPVEEFTTALLLRGLTYEVADETQLAINDFSAVIRHPGVGVEQVAMALIVRGMAYGEINEPQREIDDYTGALALRGVPIEHVADALHNRGVAYLKMNRKVNSQADFEAVIHLPNVPSEAIVNANLCLSELHFSEGRWSESFVALSAAMEYGAKASPPYLVSADGLIGAIFAAALLPEARRAKVTDLLGIYGKYRALAVLGESLIEHIGSVYRTGEPFPSADNLEQWASTWEQATSSVDEFRLSLRLLRTGVNFVKAAGKDPGILLDLNATERDILQQALGLVEKDTEKPA